MLAERRHHADEDARVAAHSEGTGKRRWITMMGPLANFRIWIDVVGED